MRLRRHKLSTEDVMENRRTEELRLELNALLRKQHEVLESRMLGTASDDDLLEYEIRQEIIHELCNILSHSFFYAAGQTSSSERGHCACAAPAAYVLSRKSSRTCSGFEARRTSSYIRRNSFSSG